MAENEQPATGRVPLHGSKREVRSGARRVGDVDPQSELELTIVVRRKAPVDQVQMDAGVSRAEAWHRLTDEAGADPEDLAAVKRYAREHGMEVVSSDAARRVVVVRTTAAQAKEAFDVELGRYEGEGVSYRGREGHICVPAELAERIDAVLGLDDRPQAHAHVKRGAPLAEDQLPDPAGAPFAAAKPSPMWPAQVAQLYSFPDGFDGSGETIGILELGGGYEDSELQAYWAKIGVRPPTVTPVSVDGAQNSPGGNADQEVLLDIEVCGAIAPGADIIVYFSGSSDRGFYDALSTAVHDTQHSSSVISISWGAPEERWTGQARKVFDDVLADAAALGITVLAAAGDHGAGDAARDGKVHADFPASSPHLVACGGTTLVDANGQTVSEVAWNDLDGWATGGGISDAFPVPDWQNVSMPANLNGTGVAGRGVPDVAGNADLVSGYIVLVHGQYGPCGGTSAVAPLYAALTARLNQALGHPVGALSPRLYALPAVTASEVFRDITEGNNSVPASTYGPQTRGYEAGLGWDACTGLGSLHGGALLEQLQAVKQAVAS